MNFHIFIDAVVPVNANTLGKTFITVFCPCTLDTGKDPHIEWLCFVCCFERECMNDDAMVICNPLELKLSHENCAHQV